MDHGLPGEWVVPVLSTAGRYIDIWKFGWGTAYLRDDLKATVENLAAHGIRGCMGGTLLEVAWKQGKEAEFLAWAADAGFPCVEVSDGSVGMGRAEKVRLMRAASERFSVLAEVGTKDASAPVSASAWISDMLGDLEAGASCVIAEGRESGTVGLYERDGTVREGLVEEIVDAVGLDKVIFEAPRKEQQAWFINRFGSDVNLGNVPVDVILGLETLRVGLRADTASLSDRQQDRTGAP